MDILASSFLLLWLVYVPLSLATLLDTWVASFSWRIPSTLLLLSLSEPLFPVRSVKSLNKILAPSLGLDQRESFDGWYFTLSGCNLEIVLPWSLFKHVLERVKLSLEWPFASTITLFEGSVSQLVNTFYSRNIHSYILYFMCNNDSPRNVNRFPHL